MFENCAGKRIFTGAELCGIDGTWIHRIDWAALHLSRQSDNAVWIGRNTFASTDGLTSTIVIYSVL